MSKGLCACILSALLLLCLGKLQAQDVKKGTIDTSNCLEIVGQFDESLRYMVGTYTVNLIRDNKVLEREELKVKKSFRFMLKKNLLYTIKIEKEGFIPRLFSIDTKLSWKVESEEPFKFDFQFNLISEDLYGHFDSDDMDFPLALISYNKKCDCFQYDEKYTSALMARLINALLYGG